MPPGAVQNVVVVGYPDYPDPQQGELPCVVIELAPTVTAPTSDEIRAHLPRS